MTQPRMRYLVFTPETEHPFLGFSKLQGAKIIALAFAVATGKPVDIWYVAGSNRKKGGTMFPTSQGGEQ